MKARWAILGAILLVVCASAVAVAAIPDANGVIHGCRDKKTGALRVIDSEAGQSCTSREAALAWNQTGPAGPQGPPGPGTQVTAHRVAFFENLLTGEIQLRALRCPSGAIAAGTPSLTVSNLQSELVVDVNFHYNLEPVDSNSDTIVDGYDVRFIGTASNRVYATLTCLSGVIASP
jgi:hypothetical protein